MKRFLKWFFATLATLILVPLIYLILVISFAGSNPPVLDGEVTLSNIESDVIITRDSYGNPHIKATNERDLYFGQGFAHAQDRFWQMSIARQMILGRLSEWIGSMGIRSDRYQRLQDHQRNAELSYAALTDDEKALLDAYAAGVNAWLESDYYSKPPEMRILHIEPEKWRATDTFIVTYRMGQMMGTDGGEVPRTRLELSGLPESVSEILLFNSTETIPVFTDGNNNLVSQNSDTGKDRAFSNSWVISGEHTTTGLPLLANDPQLPPTMPNSWHLQGHDLKGRQMAGGTVAGIPGIIVGHNGKLAWAGTNSMIDRLDINFIEINPDDTSLYRRGPELEWQPLIQKTTKISVRFGSDINQTISHTDRGFILPKGYVPGIPEPDENVRIEVKTVEFSTLSTGPISAIKLSRASTVAEGIECLRFLKVITMGIPMADTDGNIGYLTSGLIPKRPEQHGTRMGFYPDDDNNWEFLSFDENPQMINPPSGRIVAANQVIDPNFPHYLSGRVAGQYRANRIHEVLDQKEVHDVESFQVMQSNTMSPIARDLVPLLLETKPANDEDAKLLSMLKDWDYTFELDSIPATISMTWIKYLRIVLLDDETNNQWPINADGHYYPIKRALDGEKSEWCDDINTEAKETCSEILTNSLTTARLSLEEALGNDVNQWQWGNVTRFNHNHTGFGGLPILGNQFSREVVQPGGPASLYLSTLVLSEGPKFRNNITASSFQAIYDLSDLNNSRFMMSGGSSGHYKSDNYDNMMSLWTDRKHIKMFDETDTPSSVMTLKAN